MIITDNAVYLHFPKTGGTWMRDVLKPVTVDWHDHGVPTTRLEKPTFVFVRNPWAWHISMYYFLQSGSEYYNPNARRIAPPIIQALPAGHTFSTFVHAITRPTAKFKKLVYSIYQMRTKVYDDRANTAVVENEILSSWQTSDVSYCQHIYNTYTRYATHIGTYENIHDDLLNMAGSVGDLTDEVRARINNTPPINVTDVNHDVRAHYDPDLASTVADACGYIDQHGYKLEDIFKVV